MAFTFRAPGAIGAAALALLAASATASTPGTPSARATATQAAPRCFAVNVSNPRRTIQVATGMLRARNCVPGSLSDGRHFLVTKVCRPQADFGRVFWQSARNRPLGPKERLVLRVGMRQTADGKICGTFNPAPGPPPSAADYDGTYDLAFTVSESNAPTAKVGQRLVGLAFTARNGALNGDVRGGVDAGGRSTAGTTASLIGIACPANLTFTIAGSAINVNGSAECAAGNVKVKGNFAGRRTGP